jgi:hypothetical protein
MRSAVIIHLGDRLIPHYLMNAARIRELVGRFVGTEIIAVRFWWIGFTPDL